MIKTYTKQLTDWRRKFALIPKNRYGNVIKNENKAIVGIEVTRIWLSHYWTKYTVNQNRQLSEIILTDAEYYTQEFRPALFELLTARYLGLFDFSTEASERAFDFCKEGKTPADFYQDLFKETPEHFWKTEFRKLVATSSIVTSKTEYSLDDVTNASYRYYMTKHKPLCHPITCFDDLHHNLSASKLKLIVEGRDSLIPKWTLV